MCGICGIISRRVTEDEARQVVPGMVGMLHHRGPDEQGFRFFPGAALGHSRLSIIDLDTGQQPLANEDETIWVVFNGEIFNYIELREELEGKGHTFRTASDTEVLVHLYEEMGDDFLGRLNGQFAIALWDAPRQRMVLARDRFGICPLFTCRHGGRLYFASEIKAFLAVPGLSLNIDPQALDQVFTLWTVLPRRTIFSEVRTLPAGHMMVVRQGRRELKRYWDLRFPGAEEFGEPPAEQVTETIREMVKDAVRIRLRADVPVGGYLSGGLDSSIIASSVRHFTDTPLETFSIAFADPDFDESPWQEQVARHLGTRHNVVRIAYEDVGRNFPRVIWHGEKPVLRAAPAPMMLLSRLVRERDFKVVLTGEGADELFAGYDIFKENKIRRFWARRPDSAWRWLLLQRLYPHAQIDPKKGGGMFVAFYRRGLGETDDFGYSHRITWKNTAAAKMFLHAGLRDELEGYDCTEELERSLPGDFRRWHPLNQAQYLECRLLLSEYLLNSQGERIAMAHSVEGRFPFLDHRLAEYAATIPPKLKIRGLTEKYALKKAFAGLLPEQITARNKQPYGAPNKESFFTDPLPEYLMEDLSPEAVKRAGLFEPTAVERLVKKCSAGRAAGFRDNAAFLGILSTQILHRLFVERKHEGI